MRFAWDSRKAAANRRKHGITFEAAAEVFDDPNHIVSENYLLAGENEQRYQVIGLSQGMILLAVVFVERSVDSQLVIRLISARKANAL